MREPRGLSRRGLLGGATALAACTRARSPKPAEERAANDDRPRQGGRLRFGVVDGDQSGNLDAHKPLGTASVIRGFAMFAKLWEWSEEMTPRLALAEEATPNADASAWTIRLRRGLEFHNGKTITADDVIFSARRLTDPELASPYANIVSPLDRDRFQKLDDRTVRVFAKPGLGFLPLPDTWVNFGAIVPTDYHPTRNPVGAGPYKLKEFVPGQRALFTRFANYYKPGKPYADELEIVEFKDQIARLAALQGDQIDLAYGIAPEQKRLYQDDRTRLLVSPTAGFQALNLNLGHEPFRDERVRRAFRLLVDRPELVERVLNGQGRIANDLYSPQDPTFNHEIPQRPYALDEARALLRSAGKQDLQVELVAHPAGTNAAVVFAQQARRAGVDVRIKKVDLATYNGPDKARWALSTGTALGQSFLCTGINQDAPIAVANRTNFRDARFGELFLRALKTADLDARRPLVHEAQRIQHERGGLVIWGFTDTLDGYSSRVGGLVPERSQFATWRFESVWLKERTA